MLSTLHLEDRPEHLSLPVQVGIRPSGGLRLWDIKFGGQRIVYELALQEAMMSGGGTTPSQVPCSDCPCKSCICLQEQRGLCSIEAAQSTCTQEPWLNTHALCQCSLSATPHYCSPL